MTAIDHVAEVDHDETVRVDTDVVSRVTRRVPRQVTTSRASEVDSAVVEDAVRLLRLKQMKFGGRENGIVVCWEAEVALGQLCSLCPLNSADVPVSIYHFVLRRFTCSDIRRAQPVLVSTPARFLTQVSTLAYNVMLTVVTQGNPWSTCSQA